MKTTYVAVLGLAVGLVAVLSVGSAYGMMGSPGLLQSAVHSGMMGGYPVRGPMGSGSSYPSGMMGGTGMMGSDGIAGGSGMMGRSQTMGQCSQYMAVGSNHMWNGTAAGAFVAVVNGGFYPSTITIANGTTVTWVNMDFVSHTVTSGSEQAPTALFDSHELSHMQSFSYTFDAPGTYTYYCDIHPGMVGTVVVN